MSPRRAPPARKRFGQHFLEPAWVAKVVDAIDPRSDETFLEIGPGRGALTGPLSARARRVVAVEIDRDLVQHLAGRCPQVRVVQADFLAVDVAALLAGERLPARVAGNLPYNVASPILFHLLAAASDGAVLGDATLMLQREVADRLLARPGDREFGALAAQVGWLADLSLVLHLPPGAFRPVPKVRSSVVRLRFRPPHEEVADRRAFAAFVRGLFRQPRKTVQNALGPLARAGGLSAAEVLERAGVDGTRRPAALSIEEMVRLARPML